MKFKKFLLSIFLLFFLLNQAGFSQDSKEITVGEIKEHISFLASDSLKGRKPGTPEGRIAAEYIKKQLVLDGLKLIGDDGFQYFEVVTSIKEGENNKLAVGDVTAKLDEEFIPVSFSGNGEFSGDVVFVGYGFDIENDSLVWQDYKDVDVKGKWAMILRANPEIDSSVNRFENYASVHKKVMLAKDNGAAGILFVSGEKFDKKDELMPLRYEQGKRSADFPVLHIQRKIADLILKNNNQTIAALEAKLNESLKPFSFAVNNKVSASVELNKVKVKTQNVVAVLPGVDPVLKNEFIVLGAHYDHLGFGGPGSGSRRPDTMAVHNGADDNASGVAGILEVIEKLASEKKSLKRSILFIAFGAEEMGTVGSKYFTSEPLVELSKLKYMFNLDMVGRLNEEKSLSVSGTGTAEGLADLVQKYIDQEGLKAKLSPEGYGPSDHAPFYIKNIPVLQFMTSIHGDYHTPDDDVDKINFEGEKEIADVVYSLIMDVANRQDVLAYKEAGPKARQDVRRRFKVTLGIMPDVTSSEIKGLKADAVIPDRPAERAGMQKGDIIVAMEGKPVGDIYEYMNRLSEFEPGQRISVEVMRNGEKVILIVEL